MNKNHSTETLEILNDLRALGFTGYEARVYLGLLQKAPATAYEIANESGVPRPNTYSALKALTERKAVLPVSTNPVRYVPQPPERLFRSIAVHTSELCDVVADRLAQLIVDPGEHYVWDISGSAEVHDKIAEMIGSATEALWFKAEASLLRRHDVALRAAAARGVRFMIILYGNTPEEFRYTDACEVYEHEGSGFPMGFADNHVTLSVDHKEMLTANLGHDVNATHTKNTSIVKMAVSLLRHDYYMAEMFQALKPEIDAVFGPNLRSLRQHSYSDTQFSQFEQRQAEHASETGKMPAVEEHKVSE